ncbi:MAG: 3'(2'),5'-bisphosphate nucleotidase [Mongoliibacter sp.]|nr:3'(2'),5'-bisphosphate nucleotidase CysQ [Mongoliibacter sp.]TVP50763.1 MAG: 3'(2'),5'-bisphosphate nucleotidase [Mongoliibacter sp.]
MRVFEPNLEALKKTAVDAGKAILQFYKKDTIGLEKKADNSPLTLADKAAHKVIVTGLKPFGIPILSEEGQVFPYLTRKAWDYYWLVDPLDGTKEFIKGNGEFTVNIALIHKGKAILGVVYAPVLDWLYWGRINDGAWKCEGNGDTVPINVSKESQVRCIVASRSHLNEDTKKVIEKYPNAEMVSMGSSLKLLLIAEGKAELYPRLAPTMEWDTAAAHAIVNAAGGKVFMLDSEDELVYNKEDLLNPSFLVVNG